MDYKNIDELHAYMAAIIESSDDAIISKTLEGIITSWNPAAERIFGFAREEAVGKHITLIIPAERENEEFVIIGKVKAGQRIDHFETMRQTRSGKQINVSITVSPILDKNGKVIGASKIARDITDQKQAEETLRETMQRKEEFIANMSHELRTPMNAIIGLSNILSMSPVIAGKERHYVETLKQSADNLMELINTLLDFSRLESSSVELEEVEFDLANVVDTVVRIMSVKADEKKLPLRVSYQGLVNRYYTGDPLRIQQALTNLVANAIKFTDKGGVDITISCEGQKKNKAVIVLDVSDTGIGIPESKIEAIFDKFVQADASTTRQFGGSGLGLSICKTLAERMNGSITAKSRVGLGSTFTMKIELENSARPDMIQTNANDENKIRKNVLIVDDYEPNLLVVTAMLDLLGYTHESARDGTDGVRKFQEGRYDVALLDVQMPNMDGYECARRLRAIEQEDKRKKTLVVAMTAHVQEKDKHRCFEAGMDEFLAKPFELAMLTRILERVIPPPNIAARRAVS